jgi:hypothetical protein
MLRTRAGPLARSGLALLLAVSLVDATQLHLEQLNRRECGGQFDVDHALDNATIYAQVYAWMNQREVSDWTYARLVPANGTDARCAAVAYKTFVQSPTFFARLLSNFHMLLQFPIEVHKTVCVDGGAVVEDAVVTVPLLHQLTMAARYEPQDGQINSTLDAQYTLPWYIDFLVADLSEHLRSNFKHKIDTVAHTLCAQPHALPTLSSPDHAFLRGYGHHAGHGHTGKGDRGLPPPPPPPNTGNGQAWHHRGPPPPVPGQAHGWVQVHPIHKHPPHHTPHEP